MLDLMIISNGILKSVGRRLVCLLVLIFLMLSLGSCVYYNTFYNARTSFQAAESQRKNSKSRIPSINSNQYRKAIEKSLKVVENHPNSKWYDDALYVLGVSYFWLEEYAKADRRFREIIANYPESKYARESELYLAKAKLAQRYVEEAMETFETIFASDYGKDYRVEAAMTLGEYHFENLNYDEANRYFRPVRDSLGSQIQKRHAQAFIADGYFTTFKFSEALGAYLQVLGMDPDKDEKYHALYQAAICSYRLQQIDKGMDYLQTLIDDDLYFDSVAALRLTLARGYDYEGDLIMSINLYEEVGQDERNRAAAAEAYYNLGLIYQYEYDSLAGAKAYYDKAKDLNRQSEIGHEALQRSSDIGKLEDYARDISIDSTTTQEAIDEAAHVQYLLAELYWEKLNKPDTAILEMRYIVDSFPTAFLAPKAMIALAHMVGEHEDDSLARDSILHQVLTIYTKSDYVVEALEYLGLKDTPADTGYAGVYLTKAEYFTVDDLLVDSALYYYQYIIDNFPDSRYNLRARFAHIWVRETYASPGDSSLILAYTELVDSFPGNTWASEANRRIMLAKSGGKRPEGEDEYVDDSALVEDAYYDDPQASGFDEDTTTYLTAQEREFIGPDGETIPLLEAKIQPIRTEIAFLYPTEAYLLAWEGSISFHILLDFSGEVQEARIVIGSPSPDINVRATETVMSMTFDPTQLREEQQSTWLVFRYLIRKPEELR